MDFWVTFYQIAILFSMVLIGLVIGKCKIVSPGFTKDVSHFLLAAPLPCMIFNSMNIPFSKDRAQDILIMLALGAGILVAFILLSKPIVRLMGVKDAKKIPIYRFSLAFSNFGFMGLPVCEALFGSDGVMFCAIFGICLNAAYFTYGDPLFARASGRRDPLTLKKCLTPVNIGTLLGLLVFFFSIPVPEVVTEITHMMGEITSPMAMIVVGFVLGGSSFRHMLRNGRVYLFCLIRLILIPLAVYLVLTLFGLDGLMRAIPFTVAAMPSAANMLVLCERHECDSMEAAQVIFVSTLLSMLTIPSLVPLVA